MTRFFTTIAATLIATSAAAGEVTLEREIQAGSLHEGGVDMVVYYVDHQDHFEVVATYVSDTTDPARIRMGLMDGRRHHVRTARFRGAHLQFQPLGQSCPRLDRAGWRPIRPGRVSDKNTPGVMCEAPAPSTKASTMNRLCIPLLATLSTPLPALAEDGETRILLDGFRAYHSVCNHCHGPDGLGSSFGPSLVDERPDPERFLGIIRDGASGQKRRHEGLCRQ